MTDIAEIVDLPDPAVRPLVHPLDLPPARPLFRRWCLVGTVTSPPVAFCAGGLVWFASQGYVAAVAVGVALVGVGAWAGRCLDDEAWAFIPRRRWDGGRSLPLSGELASAALLAGLLVAVLLLVAGRLAQPGVPSPVRAVVFGMGAAAAWRSWRASPTGPSARPAAPVGRGSWRCPGRRPSSAARSSRTTCCSAPAVPSPSPRWPGAARSCW
jgi:hypothetical protein